MSHLFIGGRWSCPSLCCCQKTAHKDDEKTQGEDSHYFSKQEMNHLGSNKSIFYVSLVARVQMAERAHISKINRLFWENKKKGRRSPPSLLYFTFRKY